ncbi:MAG: DUF3667 domain-containing protein [Phenylobacterium sp.]|nr:DUF3667 domain-containing protein [Phenylobacterium sp.]
MTGPELEIAAADAAAAEVGAGSRVPVASGEACANCGAILQGRFCHACGQSADLRKRSILHLAWEAGESLFHLDGRLARTLPLLFFRPGKLARDLIEGRIARYTPPFRTFLVALLLYIFAAESLIHRLRVESDLKVNPPAAQAPAGVSPNPAAVPTPKEGSAADAAQEISSALKSNDVDVNLSGLGLGETWEQRVRSGLKIAAENPGYFLVVLFGWAHRLAFLLLPITAALLTVLYLGRRGIFVYDHILVASNLLSFNLLTNALGLVLPESVSPYWFLLLAVWTPVNMFQTLRGAYGSGWLGAAFKTLILWPGSVLTFGLLLVGLLALTIIQL